MNRYLLIESRDPFESTDVAHFGQLACELAAAGNEVTMVLVQNGVLPARSGARATGLQALAASGVKVIADAFSLRERGIGTDKLAACVTPAGLETVIDAMASGAKTLWH